MANRKLKIGLSDADKASMASDVEGRVIDALIDAYSPSKTYDVGDYVTRSGVVYRCVTKISTPEEWDSSKWNESNFDDVLDDVNRAVASVDKKASIDEYYQTLGAGYADNADQLNSPDFTTDQAPYLFRTSGGDADIGNREKDTIVGGSLGWNQLNYTSGLTPQNNVDMGYGLSFSRTAEGVVTVTGTITGANVSNRPNGILTFLAKSGSGFLNEGHVYILIKHLISNTSVTANGITAGGIVYNDWDNEYNSTINGTTQAIVKPTSNFSNTLKVTYIVDDNDSMKARFHNGDVINETFRINTIDLTACFGATIADYIYSLETATAGAGVAWFRKLFPKPYYPYKAIGGFLHVKLTSHDMVHFNQISGFKQGYYNTTSGAFVSNNGAVSTELIKVVPNMVYERCGSKIPSVYRGDSEIVCFDANGDYIGINLFTPISGAYTATSWKIKFGTEVQYIGLMFRPNSGSTLLVDTVKGDACFHLSWSGWRDGQYEAYKKNSYPLDTSVILRGIPKLDADNNLYYDGDKYHSDGTVEEYGYELNLADLNFVYDSNGYWRTSTNTVALYNLADSVATGEFQSDKWTPHSVYDWGSKQSGDIIINTGNAQCFVMSTDSNPPTGKILLKRKAPTTSSADPFQETQEVDDFGTEEYVVPEQDGVQVPVGHYTEYPENLRDKLRRLPNMPTLSESTTETYAVNYNGQTKKCSFVPINDWLVANGFVAQQDLSSGITDIAGLTYSVKKSYKIGNIVELSLMIQNKTGSSIPSQTILFNLGSNIKPLVGLLFAYTGTTSCVVGVSSNGDCNCNVTIANNDFLFINVSYAVA